MEKKETLTLKSESVVKAVVAAVMAESVAYDKWVKAASQLYMTGLRHGDLVREKKDSENYKTVRAMVLCAYKPDVIAILTASSVIGLTDQQRRDRRYFNSQIDNLHMARIREHLKKFEDSERGASERKTFGEVLGAEVQGMIDRIKRAKEDKIDFDAVEAIDLLKELKQVFLK